MTLRMRNTNDRFGYVARGFHWVMAFMILFMLVSGFRMVEMEFSPGKLEQYALHKSVGLLVLALVVLRVSWRFISRAPKSPRNHKNREKLLSKTIHIVFYLSMALMPLSGWAMSSAGDFPNSFFGLYEMPKITAKDEHIFALMKVVHLTLVFIFIAGILLHIVGALKHAVIDRDSTFERMGVRLWVLIPFIAAFALTLFLSAQKLSVFVPVDESQDDVISKQQVQLQKVDIVDQDDGSGGDDAPWVIDPTQSRINFSFSQYGQSISSHFEHWDADIVFDPDNLDASNVRVEIDVESIKTGSADRDRQALESDWFDVEVFPNIIFESERFTETGDRGFNVEGQLQIRDVTLPFEFPFTLEVSETDEGVQEAQMRSEFALSRLKFSVGQGQWQSTEAIEDMVEVQIEISASSR